MKKLLALVIVIMLMLSLLLARIFFSGKKDEATETKEEVIEKEKTEEIKETAEEKEEEKDQEAPSVEETKETEDASGPDETITYVEQEGLYRMLDFDRRLILRVGQQDNDVCSIFNLAYARGILDENNDNDPYDYYDGDGADWRSADFTDIALDYPLATVLQRAYDEIDDGRPTIFFVSGRYGTTIGNDHPDRHSSDHYVLIIGYRLGADRDDLKPSDFYAADPSGGYCYMGEGCLPWITLTDDAPEKVSGEYALYTDADPSRHAATCIAYPDSSRWDDDLSEPIYPAYAE